MTDKHPFLNLDQRLLVMGSRHDVVLGSPAAIVCNLDNSGTGIKSKVVGVSIESAGFTHFIRNVPPKLTSLTFIAYNSDLYADGTEVQVFIDPAQYDIVSFAAALQAGFDAYAPGVITITVVAPPGKPQTISYQLTPGFAASGNGYITIQRGKNLARVMGVSRALGTFFVEQTAAKGLFPLLYGEQCVYIYSKALTASRSSLAGHQVSDSVIGTIPVTVPFGFVQTVRMADAERPTVVYGVQTAAQLENIDMEFRDADRDLIDLSDGQGEIFCTVRLWLHAH